MAETPWSINRLALVCRMLGDRVRLAVVLCLLERAMPEDGVASATSIPIHDVHAAVGELVAEGMVRLLDGNLEVAPEVATRFRPAVRLALVHASIYIARLEASSARMASNASVLIDVRDVTGQIRG